MKRKSKVQFGENGDFPAPPPPPQRPTGEVIAEGCSEPTPWVLAENSGDLIMVEPGYNKTTTLKQSKLNSLKEFIMKALKEYFKVDFEKMWETIQIVGGMALGCVAVFFIVTGMNTCQKQSNEATLNELNAKNKAMQECIDKTQKVWECKESLR